MSHSIFAALVLSTVLVAAAGYLINDYFDVRMDTINKPKKTFIGKNVRRRSAIKWHIALSVIGLLLGFAVAYKVGVWALGFVHLASFIMLLQYSEVYKRKLLTGNLLIAFLTAFTVIVPALYETVSLSIFYINDKSTAAYLIYTVALYSGFAFITTLIREIIKDIEDIPGDLDSHCQTLPIVIGIQKTKWVLFGLMLTLWATLGYYAYMRYLNHDEKMLFYTCTALIVPSIYAAYLLYRATQPTHFKAISTTFKIIMVAGIGTLPLLYFLFRR
jgi:4-hydroxybenzoate polyprenyltransferase